MPERKSRKSGKKSKKSSKKAGKRGVTKTGSRRLLHQSSGLRVTAKAALATKETVEAFLQRLGEKCIELLAVKGAKTAKTALIRKAAHLVGCVCPEPGDFIYHKPAKGEPRYSRAGCVASTGLKSKGFRISAGGRETVTALAEALAAHIGARGKQYARVAKRETISSAMVKAVANDMRL